MTYKEYMDANIAKLQTNGMKEFAEMLIKTGNIDNDTIMEFIHNRCELHYSLAVSVEASAEIILKSAMTVANELWSGQIKQ